MDAWCDGCGWTGPSMSSLFERASTSEEYNEMVLDTQHWQSALPQCIEAFVGVDEKARSAHADFLEEYGLTAADVPLVQLDTGNWDQPFS